MRYLMRTALVLSVFLLAFVWGCNWGGQITWDDPSTSNIPFRLPEGVDAGEELLTRDLGDIPFNIDIPEDGGEPFRVCLPCDDFEESPEVTLTNLRVIQAPTFNDVPVNAAYNQEDCCVTVTPQLDRWPECVPLDGLRGSVGINMEGIVQAGSLLRDLNKLEISDEYVRVSGSINIDHSFTLPCTPLVEEEDTDLQRMLEPRVLGDRFFSFGQNDSDQVEIDVRDVLDREMNFVLKRNMAIDPSAEMQLPVATWSSNRVAGSLQASLNAGKAQVAGSAETLFLARLEVMSADVGVGLQKVIISELNPLSLANVAQDVVIPLQYMDSDTGEQINEVLLGVIPVLEDSVTGAMNALILARHEGEDGTSGYIYNYVTGDVYRDAIADRLQGRVADDELLYSSDFIPKALAGMTDRGTLMAFTEEGIIELGIALGDLVSEMYDVPSLMEQIVTLTGSEPGEFVSGDMVMTDGGYAVVAATSGIRANDQLVSADKTYIMSMKDGVLVDVEIVAAASGLSAVNGLSVDGNRVFVVEYDQVCDANTVNEIDMEGPAISLGVRKSFVGAGRMAGVAFDDVSKTIVIPSLGMASSDVVGLEEMPLNLPDNRLGSPKLFMHRMDLKGWSSANPYMMETDGLNAVCAVGAGPITNQ